MLRKKISKRGILVLKTLLYADIFDYPLTAKEIHQWLISNNPDELSIAKRLSFSSIKEIIETELAPYCIRINDFIAIKPQKKSINQRQQRQIISTRKLQIAQYAADKLKQIPTISLVAITGALAMYNTPADDDIDLMIVSKPGMVWITRLWTVALLEFYRIRRRPNQKDNNNKICANLFLDQQSLQINKGQADLYLAHEILQAKPLWSRENTYRQFLTANQWTKSLLPNAWQACWRQADNFESSNPSILLPPKVLSLLEKTAYYLQQVYMRRHQTREIINQSAAYFHPRDYRSWVNQTYQSKLKLYKIDIP